MTTQGPAFHRAWRFKFPSRCFHLGKRYKPKQAITAGDPYALL